MDLKRTRAAAITAMVVAAGVAFQQGWVLFGELQFNHQLHAGELGRAARHGSDWGRLAAAYAHGQQGRFQESVTAYGALSQSHHAEIRQTATYNMGNAFLQRGVEMLRSDESDLATPLLELAKQAYRDTLRIDHGDWRARYNLARALRLLPDLDEQSIDDYFMPEHSPRSVVISETSRELP